ncbi:MAG: hypothetical protein GY906_40315 [bacterium]|nr:hypothetical protein [bacterium]
MKRTLAQRIRMLRMTFAWPRSPLVAIAMLLGSGFAGAATIYVDLSLPSDCPTTYDVATRSCGTGSSIGYASLGSGLSAADPGDTVFLRQGEYGQVAPPSSGSAGNPITIQAYPGELATVNDLTSSVAITMDGLAHIIIDGLEFHNVRGFGHVYDSQHIEIRNCVFDITGVGTTGSMKLARSTFCRITDNQFANGDGDVMVLQDASDYNLIARNSFFTAHHSLLSIRCSEFNVIRGNTFDNPDQKAVEVYDCEGTSDAPYRLDSTERNLFENNDFIRTRADIDDHSYNGIQHAAQRTIVRHNVFRNCLGGGVSYQHYSDEALWVYGNRMYNNTFYANDCHAIIGSATTDTGRYFDQQVKNNLLYKNRDCFGDPTQIRIPNPATVILTGNTLATEDPLFVDEMGGDLRLADTSPHIDTGLFVTSTTSAGSGQLIPVADVTFFFDGYGIPGEIGDLIQLQDDTEKARLLAIDYALNVLTVDTPLSWTAGQGVHLAYAGDAPEVGAHENTGLIFSDGFESGDTTMWSN